MATLHYRTEFIRVLWSLEASDLPHTLSRDSVDSRHAYRNCISCSAAAVWRVCSWRAAGDCEYFGRRQTLVPVIRRRCALLVRRRRRCRLFVLIHLVQQAADSGRPLLFEVCCRVNAA